MKMQREEEEALALVATAHCIFTGGLPSANSVEKKPQLSTIYGDT